MVDDGGSLPRSPKALVTEYLSHKDRGKDNAEMTWGGYIISERL